MITHFKDSIINELREKRNILLMLNVGLIFLLIILSLIIWTLSGKRERFIITPAYIDKSFWVDSEQVSSSYLEQMATFFAQLVLNVTPRSIDRNNDMVLQYTDPEGYGDLKSDLIKTSEKIKKEGIITTFFPLKLETDSKNLSVKIEGDLLRMIGKEELPLVRKTYEIQFKYTNGKLFVHQFKEVIDEK